jgi:chemotaxis response regulator CheB
MPASALQTGAVDQVLPVEQIGPALIDRVDAVRRTS